MICQCKVNYLSLTCIYCTLIPVLYELPYLFLEIINHFIIVFIFSSFSFPSNLSKKKKSLGNVAPFCHQIHEQQSRAHLCKLLKLTKDVTILQRMEMLKVKYHSVAFSCRISNYLQTLLDRK